MTDDEVADLFRDKDIDAWPLDKVCQRCRAVWGRHVDLMCVDDDDCTTGTTFMPAYSIPTWVVGDKISRIAPSKKAYKEECPCGINPSQCEYHR